MKKKYPSSGDTGKARLSTGKLAGKDDALFEAMGTLDELNSIVGWVRCVCNDKTLDDQLGRIQKNLFEVGGVAGGWSGRDISSRIITQLEKQISAMNEQIPDFHSFILPGGCELAGRLHIARTVTRRAERRISAILADDADRKKMENTLRFINRLSDWFYTAACFVNAIERHSETVWQSKDVKKQK